MQSERSAPQGRMTTADRAPDNRDASDETSWHDQHDVAGRTAEAIEDFLVFCRCQGFVAAENEKLLAAGIAPR